MAARLAIVAAVALALPAVDAVAAHADDDGIVVQDLAYGEVLFEFFQEDYFSALTRLLAAQERGELKHHGAEAELMLGGLYLSYGQHRLAGEIFERVLEQSVDPALHDRAWYFLAKIWQQRGYLPEAGAALARIRGELPEELEPERQMLHAQVLMEQGRFADALTALAAWRRPGDAWVGYARYNIGVSLVRLGQVEEGARVLDEVGRLDPENPAFDALRDKANVALGYAWLQAARPVEAKPSLQRVRLDGPFSNKALLGVGWSDAETTDYRAALAPWLVLRERSLLDSAVQESMLAVPYAFAQLGANKQAADHYVDAIEAFSSEIVRLTQSIDAIEKGELITELLGEHLTQANQASGWYWRLERIPDTVESRYLYELLASNRFQEGLKNYRDLVQLNRNLDRWTESLGAFDDILDTRQRAYEQRLPTIDASLQGVDLAAMTERRVELTSRLQAIERSEDVVALGTAKEQENWARIEAMEAKLALLPHDAESDEMRAKYRFLRGLLLWDLRRDYKARLWAEHKALGDLDRQLREAQRRHHQVSSSRDDWPEKFVALTARIDALTPRVHGLQTSAQLAVNRQQDFLQDIAVEELKAQRDRLNTYMVQARFALASIYDRAAARVEPPAGGGSAVAAESGQ
ncbi:MAG TPA: tetratricopeptide repeat protein [Gammaproteobacteria bacterium]|nr:tetratricopeptide repeat protein [Gammaproteobacteria bacterium]